MVKTYRNVPFSYPFIEIYVSNRKITYDTFADFGVSIWPVFCHIPVVLPPSLGKSLSLVIKKICLEIVDSQGLNNTSICLKETFPTFSESLKGVVKQHF